MRVPLRLIAWLGSVALFAVLLFAFLVVNMEEFSPSLLRLIAEGSGDSIAYKSVGFEWLENGPQLQVQDLNLLQQDENELFALSVENVQIQLAWPLFSKYGLQVLDFTLIKPKLAVKQYFPNERETTRKPRYQNQDFTKIAQMVNIRSIESIDIKEGEFELMAVGDNYEVETAGEFTVNGLKSGEDYFLSANVTTSNDDQAQFDLKLTSTRQSDDVINTEAEIIAKDIGLAWLASFWRGDGQLSQIRPDQFSTMLDAGIQANWADENLLSLHWDFSLSDSGSDGDSSNVEQIIANSSGNVSIDSDTPSEVQANFEINSIDNVLANYKEVIPPEVYPKIKSQIESLRIKGVGVSVAGSQTDMFDLGITVVGDDYELKTAGEISLNTSKSKEGYFVVARLTASNDSQTQIELNLSSARQSDDSMITNAELIAKDTDLAWLASFLSNGGKQSQIDTDQISAMLNADIRTYWVDHNLQSLHWDFDLGDSEIDGDNTDSGGKIFAESSGSVSFEASTKGELQADFEIKSIDVEYVLANYKDAFPPKFYRHVSSRINSLEITDVTGSIAGSLAEMFKLDGNRQLHIDGKFEKLSYRYGNKWPPLEKGEGRFEVRGNEISIIGGSGIIHNQSVRSAVAVIDDFSVPDPIMKFDGEIGVPFQAAIDFFGENGIVNPGRMDAVTGGTGNGMVEVSLLVPLRRGKQFSLDGKIHVQDVAIDTLYKLQVSNINGQIEFDRAGVTRGKLVGSAAGGEIKTGFVGTGGPKNTVISGVAEGRADIQAFKPMIGNSVVDHLDGKFNWKSSYEFTVDEKKIDIFSSLAGLESRLPAPLQKLSEAELPLNAVISTTGKTKRRVEIQLDSLATALLTSSFSNARWSLDSGIVKVGGVLVENKVADGLVLAITTPNLNLNKWSQIISDNQTDTNLDFTNALQEISVNTEVMDIARGRKLFDISVMAEKSEHFWEISVASDDLIGKVQYRNAEFIDVGEAPSIVADFSKCHIPAAETEPMSQSVKPQSLPQMDLKCADTRYGQYLLGKGIVKGVPDSDRWRISSEFSTSSYKLVAKGEWLYSGETHLDFGFNSTDFGKSMDELGYVDRMTSGNGRIDGQLLWKDALTNWRSQITSGKIEIDLHSGSIKSETASAGGKLIGALNYETLFKRFSNDIGDVLSGDGIIFDDIAGSADIENGVIEIAGISIAGPSAEIGLTGTTNWNKKEHDLTIGVEPKVGKSLTTVGVLLGANVFGAVTYLGRKFLESQDVALYSMQYDITGSWDEPVISSVGSQILKKSKRSEK